MMFLPMKFRECSAFCESILNCKGILYFMGIHINFNGTLCSFREYHINFNGNLVLLGIHINFEGNLCFWVSILTETCWSLKRIMCFSIIFHDSGKSLDSFYLIIDRLEDPSSLASQLMERLELGKHFKCFEMN